MDLTQDEIKFLFRHEDGALYWKPRPENYFGRRQDWISWTKRFSGKRAGCVSKRTRTRDYRVIGLNDRLFFEHRLILILFNGPIPEGLDVDHIDGNGLNNRLANLRLVDRSTNNKNMIRRKDNTSGQVGVNFERGAWRARIVMGKKCVQLGRFKSFEEACAARKAAEASDFYTLRHGETK